MHETRPLFQQEMTYAPPTWLAIDADTYKRMLNRRSVAITKRDRKRGGTYQVREAMDAVHAAFHRCDGTDPYDGFPLDGGLLATDDNAAAKTDRISEEKRYSRVPTVDHLDGEPVAQFEIVSRQTSVVKNEMTPDEYIAHCRAVVAHADKTI